MARTRKIDDTLCELEVLRSQCGLDFALGCRRIECAIERPARYVHGIIETQHGISRARYGIDGNRRKQDRRKQGDPDARRAQSILLRWFQTHSPDAALPDNQGVSAAATSRSLQWS